MQSTLKDENAEHNKRLLNTSFNKAYIVFLREIVEEHPPISGEERDQKMSDEPFTVNTVSIVIENEQSA